MQQLELFPEMEAPPDPLLSQAVTVEEYQHPNTGPFGCRHDYDVALSVQKLDDAVALIERYAGVGR